MIGYIKVLSSLVVAVFLLGASGATASDTSPSDSNKDAPSSSEQPTQSAP